MREEPWVSVSETGASGHGGTIARDPLWGDNGYGSPREEFAFMLIGRSPGHSPGDFSGLVLRDSARECFQYGTSRPDLRG